jgi:hypothetical protein
LAAVIRSLTAHCQRIVSLWAQGSLLAFICLLATSAGEGSATEPVVDLSPAPQSIDRSEHAHVFFEAIHILGGNVNVISKWTDPIRLAIIGDIKTADINSGSNDLRAAQRSVVRAADYARTVIADIADLTGLTVSPSSDSYTDVQSYLDSLERSARFTLSDCDAAAECANFFVVFATVAEMKSIAEAIPLRPVYQRALANPDAVKCFFSPFQTGYMEIRQALVFVREDLTPSLVQTCVQEEIYQSFGMFNDSTGSRYFSFNNRIEPKAITQYDRALLQTIYDPRFQHGAPAFAVVKQLMQRLGFDPFGKD